MSVGASGALSLPARLLRGFATDFLTSHDVDEVERIMDPAYRLDIGGHVFDGRDNAYLPATAAQLDQFPGLVVTVHDVVLSPDHAAMRFTEHGVSPRHGRAAAWGGVTLFRIEGGRLRHGWAEEDYLARKRQLKAGACDPIAPPHPAPWDAPVEVSDARTESAVRDWLAQERLLEAPELEEIRVGGPRFAELVAPDQVRVTHLFSAGARAAFHAECVGTFRGGFEDVGRAQVGVAAVLRVAGIADVADGRVARVQLSADRLGLHRSLLDASS